MKLRLCSAVLCSLMALGAAPAHATLLQFSAEGIPDGAVDPGDWTVVFQDDSGDGLLQLSEIVSFSGTTVSTAFGFTYVYDSIVGVPDIPGLATLGGPFLDCCWWFDGPLLSDPATGADGWFPSRWRYGAITAVPGTPPAEPPRRVPEPGSLLLLGLAGLGLVRRRRSHFHRT